MRLLGMAAALTILMAWPSTVSAQGPSGPRHRPWLSPDRLEDIRDRREDIQDRREDRRDRRR